MGSWININDALPEIQGSTSDYVLGYDKNLGALVCYRYNIADEIYWESKVNRTTKRSHLNITHWKPLPITPQQEEIDAGIRHKWIEKFLRKIRLIN